MTLNIAIESLEIGKAAKRPCMRGYIYAKDISEPKVVSADGGEDVPEVETEPVIAHVLVDKDGNETMFCPDPAKCGECKLDRELFLAFIAEDWEIADRADYESARIGGGRW